MSFVPSFFRGEDLAHHSVGALLGVYCFVVVVFVPLRTSECFKPVWDQRATGEHNSDMNCHSCGKYWKILENTEGSVF